MRVIQFSESIDLSVDEDGTIRYGKRLWVLDKDGLRKEILKEAHSSAFLVYSGSTKMYQDLKQHFWWIGLKRDVVEYVSKCLTCQQVRVEYQRPGGELQPLEPPE